MNKTRNNRFGFCIAIMAALIVGVSAMNVSAQCEIFEDDFEDGNLSGWTEDGVGNWAASATAPITGANSLKHNLSGVNSTNYIYASPSYDVNTGDVTWRLNMKNGNWDPSAANRFWFVLMSDDSNLRGAAVDGYAVGVFNQINLFDTVAVVRVTSGVAETVVVASDLDWGSAQTVGIEVTRTAAGVWELKTDANGGFDSLTSWGTASDTTYTDSSFLGALFQCTTTRAGEFWVDDICISQSGSSSPSVAITTADDSVPNGTATYDVSGTANTNTIGELTWTNDLTGGSGTIAVSTSWTITAIPVGVGANLITVSGTNNASLSAQDSVTITRDAPPATNISFTASSASVAENAGTYIVTVTKSLAEGNVSGEVGLSGTATEGGGDDYTIDTTNFTMNGATTSATFTVTVNNNGDLSAETVILTLANVAGGTIVSPSVFTLTINPLSVLLISEVADPSDNANARFVELYNAGGSSINLPDTSYYLARQANGNTNTIVNLALTGTVAAGSTYIIAVSAADYASAYPSAPAPNQIFSSLTINGDDGVFLFVGGGYGTGTVSDAYGVLGVDGTGEPWEYEDTRAVRTSTVTQANATWTASEWHIPASAAVADMTPGVHPDGAPTVLTNVFFFAASASANENSGTFVVTVFKSLAEGNVSGEIGLGGTATEGGGNDYTIDTTNFTMNGTTTSATFTISINNDILTEVSETVILSLTNVSGGTLSSPAIFTLTIVDNDAEPEGIAAFRFTANPHLEVTTKDANIAVSNMSLSAGTIDVNITTGTDFPNEPYVQESGGWTVDNQAAAKHFKFTIDPAPGYKVSVTGITFRALAVGTTGPSAIGYDINGGAATAEFNTTNSVLLVISNVVTGVDDVTTPIDILIQGWTNGTRVVTGAGDFRLDDVVVFGRVELVGGGGDTTLDEYEVDALTLSGGTFSIMINTSSNGVPYTLIYTTNILTDPSPVGTGTADTENGNGSTLILQDVSPASPSRLYWIRSNN